MDSTNIKRFLYINHNFLISCYSQLFDGIPVRKNSSKNEDESHSDVSSADGGISISLGAKIFGSGVDGKLDSKLSSMDTLSQTKSYAESIETLFHDDLFNKFEEELDKRGEIKSESSHNIGDFVRIKGRVKTVDMEFYNNLFGNSKKLELILSHNNDKNKNAIKQEAKSLSEMMTTLCSIVPYNKFIVVNDYVIPIIEEYLRDDTYSLSYKYGGDMTILGYITNIVPDNSDSSTNNTGFSTLSPIISKTLLSLLNKESIKIIHPIGIYY